MDQSSTPGTVHASFRPEKTPVMFAGGRAFVPLAPSFVSGRSGAFSSVPGALSPLFVLLFRPIHARSSTPNASSSETAARYTAMAQNTFVHCSVVSPARAWDPTPPLRSSTCVATDRPMISPAAPVVLHMPRTNPRFSGFTHPDVTATRFGKPSDWTKPFTAHSGTYRSKPWVHASDLSEGRSVIQPMDSSAIVAITNAVPAKPTIAIVLFPYLAPIDPLNRSPKP
mmetsp:Transcript_9160/g.40319  ORF Transcript_9160/g.40319 Transcript_9160/m.40319 type:complete len:226 (-) Transcript_9160:292-969(-)